MKTITTEIFTFDELSDEAKEKAREWYRDGALDYDWWESTYEDAANIGLKITAFDLHHGTIEGKLIFSIEDSIEKILTDHGPECETHKTALQYKNTTDPDDYEYALLEDYRIMLQHEYNYLMSDEAVDDMITCNEYTFTVSGERFD